jgi:dethiobiotin synthetase
MERDGTRRAGILTHALPIGPRARRPGLFVTGTDTGVGKTVVSCAIASDLRQSGLRVGVCKPMATGCRSERGELINDDAEALAHFADCRMSLDVINPVRFASPVAPAVAAEETGQAIDYEAIGRSITQLDAHHDVLVIEGAGGVLVPIDGRDVSLTMLDLMVTMDFPVVVVVRPVLGTLNHTAMTVTLLRQAGLRVAGLVINGFEPDVARQQDASVSSNRRWLERMNHVPVLATLPMCEPGTVEPAKGLISGAVLESASLTRWADVVLPPRAS